MTPSRWKRIEELYHATLECEPSERAVILAKADPEVRREVESLLAQQSGGTPLDHPAWAGGASLPGSTSAVMPPGTQLGPYKIEGLLGSGGMGEVFRATDTRLRRTVAIKILPRDNIADPERKRRFLQEARAASALNHPNIVTLHDIASDSGTDYLVMEFVPGKTLTDLIPPDGAPLASVVEWGAQIASALATAHAAGIVHRDIKPLNVMITPDHQVKVLDFGIAKVTMPETTDPSAATQTLVKETTAGIVVGTVSYMSPEQTRGESLDGRSDIFSLGCVLYQAATGRLPFRGASTLAIMHNIATAMPDAPSRVRVGIPQAFDHLIAACLEKDPRKRPNSAAEVAQDLKSLLSLPHSVPARGDRRSVAVVPFKLRTSVQDDKFLSAALADAVINRLGSTGKLLVRPTASVMRYSERDTEWTQVAREMNVDLVVEGSIQKMGDRVRVLVQAHQVSGSRTLLSAKHDGEMDDLFGLQDRIADAVCAAFVPQQQKGSAPAEPPTKNALAYELYMRAADRLSRLNKWDSGTAIELLTSATTLDPNFADAWARLAEACIQMGGVFDPDPRWLAMAEEAVAKTLALEPVHADAFCARGQLLWTPSHNFQNRPALKALNTALKINPGCHQAQIWRGLILFHIGLYKEARQGLEEALAVHLEDTRTLVFLAHTALYRGDYEEAYELDKRALAIDPTGIWQNLFFPTVPLYLGRPAEASAALRKAQQMVPNEPTLISVEGLVAAHEGDFARAEQLADSSLEPQKTMLHTHHLWHYAASVFAICGKLEKALPLLRRCAEMGLPNYPLFGRDPNLRALQGHSEFTALMSDLHREHEGYRKEFGFARDDAFL